jgi:predicted metal-dependent peptidase
MLNEKHSTVPLELVKARTKLILKSPFMAHLALRCNFKEGGQTMSTDGATLFYNREFFLQLEEKQLMGVLAHEILHNVFLHPFRRGDREPERFNVACDYAINSIILEDYCDLLSLPPGALYSPEYRNMTAERIYDLLPNNQEMPQWGTIHDAPKNQAVGLEIEWQIAAKAASHSAAQAGYLPSSLRRLCEIAQPHITWRDVLRNFFTSRVADDYSWHPPHQQYLWRNIIMPSMNQPAMNSVVIAVDTSGSIDFPLLSKFLSEISGILESCKPSIVYVVYCDHAVAKVDEYTAYDLPLKAEPKGGGGTAFEPVFYWVEQEGIHPEALIYFTDMYGSFPTVEPTYPVIWARTIHHVIAPFGDYIDIN